MKSLINRKNLGDVFFVLLPTLVQKSIPLLAGFFVLYRYGDNNYSDFSFLLISSITSTVIVTSGIIPTLIVDVLASQDESETIGKYFRAVIFWSILVMIGLFLANNYNVVKIIDFTALAVLSIGMIFCNLLTSVLHALDKSRVVNNLSLISLVYFICMLFLGLTISYDLFVDLYCLMYVVNLFFVFLVCINYKWLRFSANLFHITLPELKYVYGKVLWIFLPNALWMICIYFFNSSVKTSELYSHEYSWFALGYQFLSILVFIPNALMPLVLRKFSNLKRASLFSAIRLSFIYMFISAVFSLFVSLSIYYVPDFWPISISKSVFVFTLSAGVFSAGIAPLSQWLITVKKPYFLFPAVGIWGGGYLFLFGKFDNAASLFFFLNMFSYIIMLIISVFVYRSYFEPRNNKSAVSK